MAQLAIALGGAAAGGAIASGMSLSVTAGIGYGFMVGSLLGSMLFPPKIEGQRLNDLKLQGSSYGFPKPIGFGTIRVAGNCIWKTDLVEVENESSGKGGVKQVTYSYKCSFAVAFGDRPIQQVLKIWGNSKLIYDKSSDGNAPIGDSFITKGGFRMRVYLGSEIQEPDSLIESHEGIGKVPAYRGTPYIVLEDFFLTDFGNAIPNINALIAYVSPETILYDTIDILHTANCNYFDPVTRILYSSWSDQLSATKFEDDSITTTITLPETQFFGNGYPILVDHTGKVWVQSGTGNYARISVYSSDLDLSVSYAGYKGIFSGWRGVPNFAVITEMLISGEWCLVAASTFWPEIVVFSEDKYDTYYLQQYRFYGRLAASGIYTSMWYLRQIQHLTIDKDNFLWAIAKNNSETSTWLYKISINLVPNTNPAGFPGTDKLAIFTVQEWDLTATLIAAKYIAYLADDHSLIIGGGYSNKIIKFDIETGTVIDSVSLIYNGMQDWRIQDGMLLLCVPTDDLKLFNCVTMAVDKTYTAASFYAHIFSRPTWDQKTNSVTNVWLLPPSQTTSEFRRYYLDRCLIETETLASVTKYICNREGLDDAKINVSALTGVAVRGAMIDTQTSGIQFLRGLMDAYFFIGIESDWLLKFSLLGSAGVFSIADTDLGVGEGEPAAQKLTYTRSQELELPQRMDVGYYDLDRDYQQNDQFEQRSPDSVQSREISSIQFPIVFMASEAKQIAQKWLYLFWVQREKFFTSLSYRHTRIDPGDVGLLNYDDLQFTVRATRIQFGANKVMAFDAIAEDLEAYGSNLSGDSGGFNPVVFEIPGVTRLFLFDIPALRDEDYSNQLGMVIYMAIMGYGPGWHGALIRRSSDGSEWNDIRSMLRSMTWGIAKTKLLSSKGWASWDRYQSLIIRLGNGSLASVSELAVLNGANAALLQSFTPGGEQWEVIQFQGVTDNGDGTYTLRNLLRGRRGTDPFQSGHSVGNLFILLNGNWIKKYLAPNDDLAKARYYRAYSIGSEEIPKNVTFYAAGNSYKPWSAADVRWTRDGSNNLSVTWQRRTRISGGWQNRIGTVPLGEESESYSTDILDFGGSVVRTITSITPSISYTAAEQTADGFTPGDPIDAEIYQLNAVIGRGFAREVTLE